MTSSETPRPADVEFLFEALFHTTNPIIINVTSLGAAKDNAKPNTMAKRISVIAKRYSLPISSTTVGGSLNSLVSPSPALKRRRTTTTPKGCKPLAAPVVIDEDEDKDEDEDPEDGNVNGDGEDGYKGSIETSTWKRKKFVHVGEEREVEAEDDDENFA